MNKTDIYSLDGADMCKEEEEEKEKKTLYICRKRTTGNLFCWPPLLFRQVQFFKAFHSYPNSERNQNPATAHPHSTPQLSLNNAMVEQKLSLLSACATTAFPSNVTIFVLALVLNPHSHTAFEQSTATIFT